MEISEEIKSSAKEYLNVIIFAVILVLFSRAFIIEPFKIPSGSMLNTLLIGDHIFVNKLSYGINIPFSESKLFTKTPKNGNIVVFKYPKDETKDFIKRVIAIAGDTIEIKKQKIYLNGKSISEDYAIHSKASLPPPYNYPRDSYGPITVPANKIFVMGDNRESSHDSRFWGFVDIEKVTGKAIMVYWSWDSDNSSIRWSRLMSFLK